MVLRPRADAPGTLASCIDGDFESALALRGAVPALVGESASLEERLADQLARASALPVKGICLALPPLGACIEADGILADSDARYLGAWWRAALVRPLPITMLFDEQDRSLTARVPRSLETVLSELFAGHRVVEVALDDEASIESEEPASHVAPIIMAAHDSLDLEVPSTDEDDGLDIPDLMAESTAAASMVTPDVSESTPRAREAGPTAPVARPNRWHHVAQLEQETQAEQVAATTSQSDPASPTEPQPTEPQAKEPQLKDMAPKHAASMRATERRDASLDEARIARAMKNALREPEPVVVAQPEPKNERRSRRPEPEGLSAADQHHHAAELDAAHGPRPVAAIERLYAQHYVPLLGMLAGGTGDASVRAVAETWSQSFRESYSEGFAALRVTPRRPTMVFDAFDVASRLARVASARSVKALLVDSMSFDLGERVAARMRILLDRRAVLVERTTLWSALPSSTPTQMALLARGAEGLKENAPMSEPDVARGRNIGSLRRERIGSRELMKLDLVEARLRAPGAAYDERLDSIADEVADVVSAYLESLPPRTLLYVFGDHGFVLSAGANGWATGPAAQGGASPEEVLVSGHAWLADAMH